MSYSQAQYLKAKIQFWLPLANTSDLKAKVNRYSAMLAAGTGEVYVCGQFVKGN